MKEITHHDLSNRMKNHKIHVNIELFTPNVLVLLFEQNCMYLLSHYDEDTEEDRTKIIDQLNEFIRSHGLINLFTTQIRKIAIAKFLHDNGREYNWFMD